MSEEELGDSEEVANLKNFIYNRLEDLEVKLTEQISELRPGEIKKILSSVESTLANVEDIVEAHLKNEVKFNSMINELKGCISMSRACLQERKDLTPRWYRIDEIDVPTSGEIWVKDLDGHETIAACCGKAILYPAGSEMKRPVFWKPV